MADQPGDAKPAKARNVLVLVIVLAAAVGGYALLHDRNNDTPTETALVKITMKIGGTSDSVNVTFVQPSGDISQEAGNEVPSSWTGNYRVGAFVSISAQNQNDDGATTTCAILADGIQIASNSSRGSFTIAECSATVP